ncbi:MAG: NAD(P)H-dependent oxidoreductase subunit E, partial [Beijerinckiaceae bacterium]
ERQVSADGQFSWLEVECLGACCNAPMVQINNDFYEDLDETNFTKLLNDMRAGKPVRIGSQVGRTSSEPVKGQKTLKDKALYDGSTVGSWKKAFDERVKRAEEIRRIAAAEAAKNAAAGAPAPAAPVAVAAPAVAKPAAAKAAAPAKPVPARSVAKPAPAKPAVKPAPAKPASKPEVYVDDGGPEKAPATLKAARKGGPDDLKLIWGVGPKMEKLLHSMGFYHFDQVAAWSDENLRWVDRRLEGFKGRARRDDWIGQSKKLATGWRPESKLGDKPGKK